MNLPADSFPYRKAALVLGGGACSRDLAILRCDFDVPLTGFLVQTATDHIHVGATKDVRYDLAFFDSDSDFRFMILVFSSLFVLVFG